MKFKIVMLGLLTLLAGVLPLLASFGLLPETLMLSNLIYSIIIVVVGIIGLAVEVADSMSSATEKAFPILLTIIVVVAGLYPLIVNFGLIPSLLPMEEYLIPGLVIVLGVIEMIVGGKQM